LYYLYLRAKLLLMRVYRL